MKAHASSQEGSPSPFLGTVLPLCSGQLRWNTEIDCPPPAPCPTLMHGHQTWKYRTCQHKILPSWALPPFPGTWKFSASKWTSGGLLGCEFSAWKYIHSWQCSWGLILICFFSILHPSEDFLLDGGRHIVLIQTPFSKSESFQTSYCPQKPT